MKNIFTLAVATRSLSELKKVAESNSDLSIALREFEEKYPPIDLSMNQKEVDDLFQSVDRISHQINLRRPTPFTSFEKLLMAVLWKNGHIHRVQPIIDGIVDAKQSDSGFGVIFRQFGKSLIDPEEPIVDQHTLRAFCKFGDLSDVASRKLIPRKSAFRNSDQPLIDSYRKWFKSVISKVPQGESNDFKYLLDKVLFAVGKNLD
jgi:hypothetical protein